MLKLGRLTLVGMMWDIWVVMLPIAFDGIPANVSSVPRGLRKKSKVTVGVALFTGAESLPLTSIVFHLF
jgi:hypothetical protein